jgi:hypothetical protein
MSSIARILTKQSQLQQQWVRFASTQYVPGRKGYAPGFEAPEGTRENTKESPKRREIAHSLTSHLESTNNKQAPETTSAKKQYRQALKVTRHKYARELLEKQGQRQMASAEKLALTQKRVELAKEAFDSEKKKVQQHQQQVVDMLALETSNTRMQDREQKRIENRLELEQAQRDTRRKQLLKLYTATDSFVTLDNLDAKVDAVMSSEGRSFHEGFNELMHSTSTVQSEIEQRKAQLREVMGL